MVSTWAETDYPSVPGIKKKIIKSKSIEVPFETRFLNQQVQVQVRDTSRMMILYEAEVCYDQLTDYKVHKL